MSEKTSIQTTSSEDTKPDPTQSEEATIVADDTLVDETSVANSLTAQEEQAAIDAAKDIDTTALKTAIEEGSKEAEDSSDTGDDKGEETTADEISPQLTEAQRQTAEVQEMLEKLEEGDEELAEAATESAAEDAPGASNERKLENAINPEVVTAAEEAAKEAAARIVATAFENFDPAQVVLVSVIDSPGAKVKVERANVNEVDVDLPPEQIETPAQLNVHLDQTVRDELDRVITLRLVEDVDSRPAPPRDRGRPLTEDMVLREAIRGSLDRRQPIDDIVDEILADRAAGGYRGRRGRGEPFDGGYYYDNRGRPEYRVVREGPPPPAATREEIQQMIQDALAAKPGEQEKPEDTKPEDKPDEKTKDEEEKKEDEKPAEALTPEQIKELCAETAVNAAKAAAAAFVEEQRANNAESERLNQRIEELEAKLLEQNEERINARNDELAERMRANIDSMTDQEAIDRVGTLREEINSFNEQITTVRGNLNQERTRNEGLRQRRESLQTQLDQERAQLAESGALGPVVRGAIPVEGTFFAILAANGLENPEEMQTTQIIEAFNQAVVQNGPEARADIVGALLASTPVANAEAGQNLIDLLTPEGGLQTPALTPEQLQELSYEELVALLDLNIANIRGNIDAAEADDPDTDARARTEAQLQQLANLRAVLTNDSGPMDFIMENLDHIQDPEMRSLFTHYRDFNAYISTLPEGAERDSVTFAQYAEHVDQNIDGLDRLQMTTLEASIAAVQEQIDGIDVSLSNSDEAITRLEQQLEDLVGQRQERMEELGLITAMLSERGVALPEAGAEAEDELNYEGMTDEELLAEYRRLKDVINQFEESLNEKIELRHHMAILMEINNDELNRVLGENTIEGEDFPEGGVPLATIILYLQGLEDNYPEGTSAEEIAQYQALLAYLQEQPNPENLLLFQDNDPHGPPDEPTNIRFIITQRIDELGQELDQLERENGNYEDVQNQLNGVTGEITNRGLEIPAEEVDPDATPEPEPSPEGAAMAAELIQAEQTVESLTYQVEQVEDKPKGWLGKAARVAATIAGGMLAKNITKAVFIGALGATAAATGGIAPIALAAIAGAAGGALTKKVFSSWMHYEVFNKDKPWAQWTENGKQKGRLSIFNNKMRAGLIEKLDVEKRLTDNATVFNKLSQLDYTDPTAYTFKKNEDGQEVLEGANLTKNEVIAAFANLDQFRKLTNFQNFDQENAQINPDAKFVAPNGEVYNNRAEALNRLGVQLRAILETNGVTDADVKEIMDTSDTNMNTIRVAARKSVINKWMMIKGAAIGGAFAGIFEGYSQLADNGFDPKALFVFGEGHGGEAIANIDSIEDATAASEHLAHTADDVEAQVAAVQEGVGGLTDQADALQAAGETADSAQVALFSVESDTLADEIHALTADIDATADQLSDLSDAPWGDVPDEIAEINEHLADAQAQLLQKSEELNELGQRIEMFGDHSGLEEVSNLGEDLQQASDKLVDEANVLFAGAQDAAEAGAEGGAEAADLSSDEIAEQVAAKEEVIVKSEAMIVKMETSIDTAQNNIDDLVDQKEDIIAAITDDSSTATTAQLEAIRSAGFDITTDQYEAIAGADGIINSTAEFDNLVDLASNEIVSEAVGGGGAEAVAEVATGAEAVDFMEAPAQGTFTWTEAMRDYASATSKADFWQSAWTLGEGGGYYGEVLQPHFVNTTLGALPTDILENDGELSFKVADWVLHNSWDGTNFTPVTEEAARAYAESIASGESLEMLQSLSDEAVTAVGGGAEAVAAVAESAAFDPTGLAEVAEIGQEFNQEYAQQIADLAQVNLALDGYDDAISSFTTSIAGLEDGIGLVQAEIADLEAVVPDDGSIIDNGRGLAEEFFAGAGNFLNTTGSELANVENAALLGVMGVAGTYGAWTYAPQLTGPAALAAAGASDGDNTASDGTDDGTAPPAAAGPTGPAAPRGVAPGAAPGAILPNQGARIQAGTPALTPEQLQELSYEESVALLDLNIANIRGNIDAAEAPPVSATETGTSPERPTTEPDPFTNMIGIRPSPVETQADGEVRNPLSGRLIAPTITWREQTGELNDVNVNRNARWVRGLKRGVRSIGKRAKRDFKHVVSAVPGVEWGSSPFKFMLADDIRRQVRVNNTYYVLDAGGIQEFNVPMASDSRRVMEAEAAMEKTIHGIRDDVQNNLKPIISRYLGMEFSPADLNEDISGLSAEELSNRAILMKSDRNVLEKYLDPESSGEVNQEMTDSFLQLLMILNDPNNIGEDRTINEKGQQEFNAVVTLMIGRNDLPSDSTKNSRGIPVLVTDALVRAALDTSGFESEQLIRTPNTYATNVDQMARSVGHFRRDKGGFYNAIVAFGALRDGSIGEVQTSPAVEEPTEQTAPVLEQTSDDAVRPQVNTMNQFERNLEPQIDRNLGPDAETQPTESPEPLDVNRLSDVEAEATDQTE